MKISVQSNNDQEMSFILSDATVSFANLIRRYAINSVPVFAIEEVAIYENNSSFFDEYITHRLGLIPLSTPIKAKIGDEVTLMLDAEGPNMIYAENLKSTDKNVVPVYPNMPIVKLSENQNIRMECKAVLATGKQHARHQPCVIAYENDGEKFKFMLESYGQIPAETILKKALDNIKESAEEIESELNSLE